MWLDVPSLLTCTVIQCPDIADPFNGQILFATDRRAPFDYGTTAQYVCNSRFSLIGDESMRVCEGDGQSDVGVWSGYDYTCQFNGELVAKCMVRNMYSCNSNS